MTGEEAYVYGLEGRVAQLEAEVERLRKLAPWHDRPRAVVKPPNPWKGRYCRVLPREKGDRAGIVRILIEGRCYPYEFGEDAIEYVQEPTSA